MKRANVDYKKCPKCSDLKMVKSSSNGLSRQRWICRTGCGYKTTDPTAPYRGKGEPEKRLDFDLAKLGKKLVITWAQNATPVHKGFLAALWTYCIANDADLLVIPGRYKNPTSTWDASQRNEQWWAKELVPFLINKRKSLNKNLMLLADISTQPTAVSPLSGFEGLTHGESGILGHPKLQMVVIPTPHQKLPKMMTTTGAVTVQNYTDTKAGKKGEFHHVLGAVVIEIDGDKFHLRHLNARRDGAFCDLDRAYFPDNTIRPSGPYEGLVFGDAHPPFADPIVVAATFGPGGLVERLNPKELVFHDLLDSYAITHHHEGNPFIAFAKQRVPHSPAKSDIRDEVQCTIQWLIDKSAGRKAIVVPSNHDDMLARWMKRCDWREDPKNAEFYLETALHMVRNSIISERGAIVPDPFRYWVDKRNPENVYMLPRNTSYLIAGIECSLHGHEGPNGARGTMKNLSTIGPRTITGHSHTPGIEAGHYRTGTMTFLSLEYTGPVGSWLNAHVSIDPMKKRHIHVCVEGSFWA